MNKLFQFSLLSILLLVLTFSPADAQSKRKKKKSKAGQETASTESTSSKSKRDPRVMALFLEAVNAKTLEKEEEAIEKFKDCLKMDERNDAAAFEVAKLYYEKKDIDEAMRFSETAAKIDPDNKWYQFLYAELLSENDDFEGAAVIYRQLLQKYPNNFDYYFDLSYMLIKSGDLEGAIETYDQLEQRIGVNEDIIYQKQRLYIKLNDVENAAKETQKLIDQDPENPAYYVMKAEIYEANGMEKEASEIYEQLKEIDPENPMVQISMANYYKSKGENEKYFAEVTKIIENPQLEIEPTKLMILYFYLEKGELTEKQEKEAFLLTEKLMEVHPKNGMSYAVHGDLLFKTNKEKEALEFYEKALETDKSKFEIFQQVMEIHFRLKQYDQLIEVCDEAIELFPNQHWSYYFSGLAYNNQDNYEKAQRSFKRAIVIGFGNKNFLGEVYAQLADVYNSTKEYEKSDKNFDKSLTHVPDNPYTLNNYSYFLSLRGDKLDKAAEMSARSNELEPDNASFQDTYAWILYKQKKYEDSEKWMKKALDNGGTGRYVILEHYGDVLFQLGRVDEAVEHWIKAKESGAKSEMLDKKINDKKIYE